MRELNRKRRGEGLLGAALLAGLTTGCAAPPLNPHLPSLTIATRFGPDNVCSDGVLPAIAVRGAPPGTAQYRIRVTDLDVLVQRPWEKTVATSGGDIPEGAATPFPAPCLSEQQELVYRFEVMALDAGGRAVAYGQTTTLALPPGRLAAGGLRVTSPTAAPAPAPAQGQAQQRQRQAPPQPFNRAAGILGGPYVLNEQSSAPATNGGDALDPFNRVSARTVRPPPVPIAPTRR